MTLNNWAFFLSKVVVKNNQVEYLSLLVIDDKTAEFRKFVYKHWA